jgi:hypothetical protein
MKAGHIEFLHPLFIILIWGLKIHFERWTIDTFWFFNILPSKAVRGNSNLSIWLVLRYPHRQYLWPAIQNSDF